MFPYRDSQRRLTPAQLTAFALFAVTGQWRGPPAARMAGHQSQRPRCATGARAAFALPVGMPSTEAQHTDLRCGGACRSSSAPTSSGLGASRRADVGQDAVQAKPGQLIAVPEYPGTVAELSLRHQPWQATRWSLIDRSFHLVAAHRRVASLGTPPCGPCVRCTSAGLGAGVSRCWWPRFDRP